MTGHAESGELDDESSLTGDQDEKRTRLVGKRKIVVLSSFHEKSNSR